MGLLQADALEHLCPQLAGGDPGIMPHTNFQFLWGLFRFFRQPAYKRPGDELGRLRGEGHRLPFHTGHRNPAYIAAIL